MLLLKKRGPVLVHDITVTDLAHRIYEISLILWCLSNLCSKLYILYIILVSNWKDNSKFRPALRGMFQDGWKEWRSALISLGDCNFFNLWFVPRVLKVSRWIQILYDILAFDNYCNNINPSYKLRERKDNLKTNKYYRLFPFLSTREI